MAAVTPSLARERQRECAQGGCVGDRAEAEVSERSATPSRAATTSTSGAGSSFAFAYTQPTGLISIPSALRPDAEAPNSDVPRMPTGARLTG